MATTRSNPRERGAARRAAEIRRAQQRAEQRRRNVGTTVAVLAVLALVVGVSFALQSARDTTGRSATPPTGVLDTYGVPRGEASAPVTVTVFEDFLCPVCGELERATHDWLPAYVEEGRVQVVYRPLAFLDRFSAGTDYSTRAGNAYAVALDAAGPETAATFHDLLFEHQPRENTGGLTDDQLVDLAVRAGVPLAQARRGIEARTFEQWVVNATDDASKQHDVTGTPTVDVNGRRLPPVPPEQLAQILRRAVDDLATGE